MTTAEIIMRLERIRTRLSHLTADFRRLEAELAQQHIALPVTEAVTESFTESFTAKETKENESKEEEKKRPKKEEEKKDKERKEERREDTHARELFTESKEKRKQALRERLQTFSPQYSEDMLLRFYHYWTQDSDYKPGLMRFEMPGWDIVAKLATWSDYGRNTGLAMARARQAEEARQRSITAIEERERSHNERNQRLARQQEAFVPFPVLQAYTAAGFGDFRQTDKPTIIATLQRHLATPGAAPLPPVIAQWLATAAPAPQQ